MLEGINKLMLAGLGALSMSREKAEKIFDDYVSRGKVERSEKEGFIKDVMDSAEKARCELEETIAKQVHHAVSKLDLMTREDMNRLESKVDELLHHQTQQV